MTYTDLTKKDSKITNVTMHHLEENNIHEFYITKKIQLGQIQDGAIRKMLQRTPSTFS